MIREKINLPVLIVSFVLLCGSLLYGCANGIYFKSPAKDGIATCRSLPSIKEKCGERDCLGPPKIECCVAATCRSYEFMYLQGNKGAGIYYADKISHTGQDKCGVWQYTIQNERLWLPQIPATEREEKNVCNKLCGPSEWTK